MIIKTFQQNQILSEIILILGLLASCGSNSTSLSTQNDSASKLEAGIATVDFDNPAPSGQPDSLLEGVFQGINFGTGSWRWSGRFGPCMTNSIYFDSSEGKSRSFTFANQPRVLTSLSVYTGGAAGTLTLIDDVNQEWTQSISVGSVQIVKTNWTKASTKITISYTSGWDLGIDSITLADSVVSDKTPPTVSITAPPSGSQLSKIVAISANASDNVGITGVQFLLDGQLLGSEDTASPFSISWDTRQSANGQYNLSARARDAAGNTTLSSSVSVNVGNDEVNCAEETMRCAGFTVQACTNGSWLFVQDCTASNQLCQAGKCVAAPQEEWTQHAHDAQHTSFTPTPVPMPWRLKWTWNSSDAEGKLVAGKTKLPRNVQPVTGNGLVYIAWGEHGVIALKQNDGSRAWLANPGGLINSTVAYDPQTQSVFVGSTNGRLYSLRSSDGGVALNVDLGGSIDTPPVVLDDRILVSVGNRLYAVGKEKFQIIWTYDAGSSIHTPPAYSRSTDRAILATADLFVHAVDNKNGAQLWRKKPTPLPSPSTPDATSIEFKNGWPVIAEKHGLVLLRMRQSWNMVFDPPRVFTQENATTRSNLEKHPEAVALFALKLSDGSVPFISNIGHGGWGDGGYMPIGSMPLIRTLPDGGELAYEVIRGDDRYDVRWDSHFGELLLDDTTVPGFKAGYVRWIEHHGSSSTNEFLLTDEQPFLSMAGDQLFGAHWLIAYALRIVDRSNNRGTYASMITTENLPHIINSQPSLPECPFSNSRFCNRLVQDLADGETDSPRSYPGGFYQCYDCSHEFNVYDKYWSGYGAVVVSAGLVLYRSNDGAIVAIEHSAGDTKLAPFSQMHDSKQMVELGRMPAALDGRATSSEAIAFKEAQQHVGKLKTVHGQIAEVNNNGKAIYLGFQRPHQGALVIRILRKYWNAFKLTPDKLFRVGQEIRVVGKIGWYQGDPVIDVQGPAAIEIQ